MRDGERLNQDQMQAFLEASQELIFEAKDRREVYEWVCTTLVEQEYTALDRPGKGLVRRYVAKVTGLSRAQVTRLIQQYREGGEVKVRAYQRHRFEGKYGAADLQLLAEVDELHERLSGPATQKLLQRAYYDFQDERFRKLAGISVAHLYRLRASRAYQRLRVICGPTRPSPISIGERRKPEPQGRPGYLRVDTVHQGDDLDGTKGVYHINAVDEVTQWEVVAAVPAISEAWLLPVLETILAQFPFVILGFHSDCGSEFINHVVAKLLNKLLIEQTKSRPRRSNDNGLVEAKNGAVIRKHMGHWHIGAEHAEAITEFYREYFNPYLNFHRPCGVPEIVPGPKGKQKRVYRWYATPWEILRQLPGIARHLRPGQTILDLEQQARRQSDTEAAQRMQEAKRCLFAAIAAHERRTA
jgi:predicted DNA-binding transcriptional regulator AlpA